MLSIHFSLGIVERMIFFMMKVAENKKINSGQLSIFERFSYGFGDFWCNIIYTAMSVFLLKYYVDYAGVSAAAIGTI